MENDIPPPAVSHFWIYILIILVLLFLSALISGSEVAFFSLKERPHWDEDEDPRAARKIKRLLSRPQKLLATILTVNNLVNIAIVIIATYLVEEMMAGSPGWLRFLVEVVLITAVILFFGEILPKVFATRNDLQFARRTAGILDFLGKMFAFITIPMVWMTRRVKKYLRDEEQHFSHEELSHVLDLARPAATSDEQKILSGILQFGQTEAKQIMKPRVDIFALETDEPFREIVRKISEKGYSRIPVYEGDLDHIKGILFAKDLIPHLNHEDFPWQKLIRKALFVPETVKLDDLLKEFQQTHTHLAIVVDEYGGTSGLVTLEDVIEEVLGEEIQDEYDREKKPYRKINRNTFLFEGKTPLIDFYKYLDLSDEEIEAFEKAKGPAESLAGLILELHGDIPSENEKISFGDFTFTVKDVERNRLEKIQVSRR